MTALAYRASFLSRTGRIVEAYVWIEAMLGAMACGARMAVRA